LRKGLILATLLFLVLIYPVSALGILKIELPSRAVAGEEIEIKVVESLSGDPVEGATVYVNGVEIGVTDDDGEIKYVFDSAGVYLIGATKFGYTPAASISLTVEPAKILEPEETPAETPTPVETPQIEEYRGLVFKEDLIHELFVDELVGPITIDEIEVSDLIEKARDFKPTTPLAFFTDGQNYMVLYGDIDLKKSGYYRIEGYSLDAEVSFEGKSWKLFEVTGIEGLDPESVDVNALVSNPSGYAGKEIIVNGPFREVSFKVESFSAPVCIGSVSTLPIDFDGFARELTDAGENLLKDPDRETIEKITRFAGVSTFRFERGVEVGFSTQAYWKAVDAEVRALVIPANLVELLFPDELKEFISERGVVLLVEDVKIPSERVSLEDVTANPGKYSGKVVEIADVYNLASDISVKYTVSTVFPPAAAAPLDVYFEPTAMFNLPPDNVLLGFGITGFSQNYGDISDGVRIDAKYTLKGVVLTANMIDDSLPAVPALVVFERYRQNYEDQVILSDQAEEVIKTFNLIKDAVVGVKPEETPKPEVKPTETPEEPEKHETPESEETPSPEVTPITEVKLESLTLSITPSKITANPGDTINLKLKVDWEPKEWKGKADVKIILSAAGFKKEYELPGIILENPPIENEFSYSLPENLPPLTYEAKIIVEAEGKKAESSVEIKVGTSQTPGFEVVAGLVALAGSVLVLRGRK